MFKGRCKLDTLMISDVGIQLSARGIQIRAQGVIRGRNIKRPQAEISFVQTEWDRRVVDKAVELLQLLEASAAKQLMDMPRDAAGDDEPVSSGAEDPGEEKEDGDGEGQRDERGRWEDDILHSLGESEDGGEGFPEPKDSQF